MVCPNGFIAYVNLSFRMFYKFKFVTSPSHDFLVTLTDWGDRFIMCCLFIRHCLIVNYLITHGRLTLRREWSYCWNTIQDFSYLLKIKVPLPLDRTGLAYCWSRLLEIAQNSGIHTFTYAYQICRDVCVAGFCDIRIFLGSIHTHQSQVRDVSDQR